MKLKQIIFNNKNLFALILILILFTIIYYSNKINLKDKYERGNFNLVDSIHRNELFKLKNESLSDLVLINNNRILLINNLFEHDSYIIIFYINGVVCDPCIEFLCTNWENLSSGFPCGLSKALIIIQDKKERETLITLKKYHKLNSYYIDIKGIIKKKIRVNEFPANYIFLLDKNQKIIMANYFTSNSKRILYKFVENIRLY